METKKIALSLNFELPYERYHDFYCGVQEYADKYTSWEIVWDHFPEYKLKSQKEPYYAGVIGRIKFAAHKEIVRLNLPHVNSWYGSTIKEIPSVLPNMKETGRIAAQHLIDRGFRNIVNIDNKDDPASDDFFKGVRSVLKLYKVPAKRLLVTREVGEDSELWHKFCNKVDNWAKTWETPMGVCCSMSHLGFKLSRRMMENNLRIPEDVALICGFNEHAFCESHAPFISSIDMDIKRIGYESARLLDEQFKNGVVKGVRRYISPNGLVTRDSTDTFAIKDENLKIAMRYIADNTKNNINVVDVVDAVPISRRSLELKIEKIIGHTIVDEINRLRIITLKRFLKESDKKLSQLYKDTGFSSPKHMRRVFKRYTSMTPVEYREASHRVQGFF